jgi:hypothetical protein
MSAGLLTGKMTKQRVSNFAREDWRRKPDLPTAAVRLAKWVDLSWGVTGSANVSAA